MDRNSFFFESFVLLQPYTMHFCTISLRNNLLATKQNDVTIIHMKVILFQYTNCLDGKFPEISHFLKPT